MVQGITPSDRDINPPFSEKNPINQCELKGALDLGKQYIYQYIILVHEIKNSFLNIIIISYGSR
jgi:hypothetical protein